MNEICLLKCHKQASRPRPRTHICFCGGSSVSCAKNEGLPILPSLLCSTVDWTPQLVSQLQLHQSDPVRRIQSGTEITAYTGNLFACNPLIIDVKAVIYKWSVRSVFKNANACTSSPSLIIKGILCVCVCVRVHFLNRWTVNHQIRRAEAESPSQTEHLFITFCFFFPRQTVIAFRWTAATIVFPIVSSLHSQPLRAARRLIHVIFPLVFFPSVTAPITSLPRCGLKKHTRTPASRPNTASQSIEWFERGPMWINSNFVLYYDEVSWFLRVQMGFSYF